MDLRQVSYRTISVEHEGAVCTVSLNRPDVRNAFNAEMIGDLTEVFTDLRTLDGVRVVVLCGNGRSFSAGADIQWMRAGLAYSQEDNLSDALRMSDMFAAINSLPKPTIARVHGAALGGGMGLIAACDVVIAEPSTVFGFTEVKLGIIPAVISGVVLHKVGPSWARALYLTGERFGPELAQRIGLVHWIASPEEMDSQVERVSREFLTSGPGAIAAAKDLIAEARTLPTEELRAYTAERIASLRIAPEGQEGLKAFLDKRPPVWCAEE